MTGFANRTDLTSEAGPNHDELLNLPHAFGEPQHRGYLKQSPEDFCVDEELAFEPEDEGDHVYLQLEKSGFNTKQIADTLARFAGVRPSDIGYAGMKDRHAITRQWFSVLPKPKTAPEWQAIETDQLKVLQVRKHPRKLKIGALKGNAFNLVLRAVTGEKDHLENRLDSIQQYGVPNYFGPQRFGRLGQNLQRSLAFLRGEACIRSRHQKGLMYSVARSWLFNQVLAKRVELGTWNQAQLGDALVLAGTRQFFVPDVIDETIMRRIRAKDISPSGPLAGSGESPVFDAIADLEQQILSRNRAVVDGLINARVASARRPLVMHPESFTWAWQDENDLVLSFFLPAGCYATALVRELIQTTVAEEQS